MKTHFRKFLPLVVISLLVLVGTAAGVVQRIGGKPAVQVALTAVTGRKGEQVPLDKAGRLIPGELINWTITSENNGTGPAANYSVVGQVPGGTTFVEDSALAKGAEVSFSIDGGKTYAAKPITEEKQNDGTLRTVIAPVSAYTQVRYQWSNPLPAGQKFSASYQVRVK